MTARRFPKKLLAPDRFDRRKSRQTVNFRHRLNYLSYGIKQRQRLKSAQALRQTWLGANAPASSNNQDCLPFWHICCIPLPNLPGAKVA
jgi:hypothetical protein